MKSATLLRALSLVRNFVVVGVIFAFTFAYSGLFDGIVALADEPSPAEAGPIPQGGLSRLGRGSAIFGLLSPDERRLAVTTLIGVTMYDAATMRQIWYSEGYDVLPVPISFSHDSKRLAGRHGHDHLVSWDVETGQILAEYSYKSLTFDVAFSGDDRYLLGASGDDVVAWDAATSNLLYAKDNPYSYGALTIAASPDGTLFATGGTVTGERDQIPVWDTATGEIRHTFKVELPGDSLITTGLDFSPDNKYLVVTFQNGWIKGWDLTTGTLAFTKQVPNVWSSSVNFSPDSSQIAVGNSRIDVYRIPSLSLVRSYTGLPTASYIPWFGLDGKLKSFVIHSGIVTIIDPASGAELARLEGHLRPNTAAALTPDGATLILGKSDDGILEVRDVASTAVRMTLKGNYTPDSLSVSPDGAILAGIFRNSKDDIITKVMAWDLTTGQRLYTISDYEVKIRDIQFSPDSATMLISYANGLIKRVGARTGGLITKYDVHAEQGNLVTLAPDGRTAALWSGDHVRLWDLPAASLIREFPLNIEPQEYGWPSIAAFSPDGSMLAAGNSGGSGSSTVYLWDTQTGQRTGKFDDELNHDSFAAGIRSIAFSLDNTYLAVGNGDGTILLVNTRSWELSRILRGHGYIVEWMGFLPGTSQLISASRDGTVVFWQAP